MAIWNLALLTGATMGSVIGGYISEDLTWRYNFGLAAIALGLLFFGFFFFLPETVYIRDLKYNLDEQSHEDLSGGFEKNTEGDAVQMDVGEVPPLQSYKQMLRPWTGKVYDHDSRAPSTPFTLLFPFTAVYIPLSLFLYYPIPPASQFDRHLNPTNSISPFDIYHFPSHERSTDCRLLQNRLPSSPAVLLTRRLLGNPLLRHLGNLARCLWRNSRTSLWRPTI